MKEEQPPRWPCWAAFAGAALVFLIYWQWLSLGAAFYACDANLSEAAFIACDDATGRVQTLLSWIWLPALIVAAIGEWRRRWLGLPLLLSAAILMGLLPWAMLRRG